MNAGFLPETETSPTPPHRLSGKWILTMTLHTKIRFHRSIFVQVAMIIAICISLVTSISGYLSLQDEIEFAKAGIISRAETMTGVVADQSVGPIRSRKLHLLTETLNRMIATSNGDAVDAVAVASDGAIIAFAAHHDATNFALRDLARRAFTEGEPVRSADGFALAKPVLSTDELVSINQPVPIGAIATQWSSDRILQQVHADAWRDAAISGVIFILTLVATQFFFHSMIMRPIGQMAQAMRALQQRQFDITIPATARKDEIGAIGKTLEDLRDALAQGEAAKAENTYKSAAFMGSSAAMMLIDAYFTITYLNTKMQAMLEIHGEALRQQLPGFDPRAVIGMNLDSFHETNSRLRHALAQPGQPASAKMMTLGDARISVTMAAVRAADDAIIGYVVEWADVTQDWLNQAIIDAINSNQIKAEFNVNGQLILANDRFHDLIGSTAAQVKGMTLQTLLAALPSDRRSQSRLVQSVLRENAFLGRLSFLGKDNAVVTINGGLSCVRDHSGQPIRLLLIGRDVTAADTALAAAQAERIDAEYQQTLVVDALRVGLRQLSNGDLTQRIDDPFDGKYEELRQDYNRTVETLSGVMREVIANAESIKNEARDISTTTESLSRRTESTAATLEQTAAALDELTASVRSAAEGAAEADTVVAEARINAEQSGTVVLETVCAMDQIAASSDKITSIIKVIDNIAFQTNLLALNAGVEAARAGDAGRGFAVVASEVRALAQRSSEAAREINDLIANSATQVRHGVDLVGKTGEALKQIVASVSNISTLVSEIAVSSRQQSTGLAEINSAMNHLDQSTQQNAARLEETTAASESLTNGAIALSEMVAHFTIDGTAARETVVNFKAANRSVERNFRSASKTSEKTSAQSVIGASRPSVCEYPAFHKEKDAAGWEDF